MMTGDTYMKLRSCAAVVLASVMSACTGIGPMLPSDTDIMQDYPVTLTVSQDEMTRIGLSGNSLLWETGDQIQLTAVTAGIEVSDTIATSVLKVFDIDPEDRSKASFAGFVTLRSEPKSCYFTHPAGETMSVDAVKGTVKANYSSQDGTHKPFLYGKTKYAPEGMDVVLKHFGAVLEITVETPGVTHISLVGNGIESLSPFMINPTDDSIEEPDEAVTQITVPVQTEGKTYIFVPPVNFEKGFSLVCSNGTESSFFVKSYSDGTGRYDFSSKRGAKIPITISGEFKQFAVTSSDLTIVHSRNDDGLLTGTTVSFKMSKTGSPDKLIDSWGATLTDAKGNVVRTYSSKAAITGSTVTMDVSAGDIFLEAGAYTFTPYFYMYGKPVSLENQVVTKTIDGPGIVLNISGSTSYDKYKAGNVDGANLHANTLLSGLSVSTNVAADVISEFSYSLVGDDNTKVIYGSNPSVVVADSSTIASFGDKTCSKFQGYTMSAGITVGNIRKEATRVFHITGLPYEIDFSQGDNSSWAKYNNAEYSDSRMFFKSASFSEKTSAVRSPKFYLPENINVLPYADASIKGNLYTRKLYVSSCAYNESNIITGTSEISIHKGGFSAKGLQSSSAAITLTNEKPALMFTATTPLSYGIALYKIQILYN